MTNSPLTLRRINRLIGQALRLIQLTKAPFERIALQSAARCLNKARATLKAGRSTYTTWLTIALDYLRDAQAERQHLKASVA